MSLSTGSIRSAGSVGGSLGGLLTYSCFNGFTASTIGTNTQVSFDFLVTAELMATGILLGLLGLSPLPESVWRAVGLAASIATFGVMLFGVFTGLILSRMRGRKRSQWDSL